jgi:hypothetical protein
MNLRFADLDGDGYADAVQQPSLADFASRPLGDPLSGLFSLFGGEQPSQAPQGPVAPGRSSNPLLDKIQRVAERHGFAARVYRTAAGHQVMVTNRRIRGGAAEAETLRSATRS